MALLLTAPGIPQLFMGQEFLEDKQWCPDPRSPDHLIWWGGLAADADGRAADPAMADHLRFTQAAIALRNSQPALRGEGLNVFYTSDADRVIAFHRWVQGVGRDVVVVATLSETTWGCYQLGFPSAGRWIEIFNSDAYDSCNANGVLVNPQVAGNDGGVNADDPPLHNMPASATACHPRQQRGGLRKGIVAVFGCFRGADARSCCVNQLVINHPPSPPPCDKVVKCIQLQVFTCKVLHLDELDSKYKKTKEPKERARLCFLMPYFKDSRLGITTMPTIFVG